MRAWVIALLCIGLSAFLAGCERPPPSPVAGAKALLVAIRESPTTYSLDADGNPGGFEYDLVAAFAQHEGLSMSLVVLPRDIDMYRQLQEGKAHLAVGWLSAPRSTPEKFRATRPYFSSRMAVVQHEAALPVDTPDELVDKPLYVAAGSHLAERLYRLREKLPKLQIVERADPGGLDLLRDVAAQSVELAVTDAPVFDIAQNFFPELQSPTLLGEAEPISWLLPAAGSDELFAKAQAFLVDAETNGTLARLKDRYFGHIHRLRGDDAIEFLGSTKSLLPRYHGLFKQAQIRSGIDWRLLAALAYQESKWDPLATSPTNVRGMMMLTEDTADRLHVTNRLDPRQSILAGADYLADLRDSLPSSIAEPDRTWMALAAYNLGMGHLNGARQIALGMKANVDHWHEMKRTLPLMARPEYYRRLKSGRARGGEAVVMVENIRAYFDILQRHLPAYDPLTQRAEETAAARTTLPPIDRAPGDLGLRPPLAPGQRPTAMISRPAM